MTASFTKLFYSVIFIYLDCLLVYIGIHFEFHSSEQLSGAEKM